MDDLIGILIQALIDLFSKRNESTPQQGTNPRIARPPQAVNPRPAMPPPLPGRAVAQGARKRPPVPGRAAKAPAPKPVAPVVAAQHAVLATAPAAERIVPHVAVDAAALRKWMTPATLRTQFMLTEIFQPPVGMRE